MISKTEALDKFREIIGTASSWAQLLRSQFVEFFSIFQSWALRDALWKVERTEQEIFLSTSINRSSIVAHAEDREYVPRKPDPSTGTVTITNGGAATVAIPLDHAFISEMQIDYVCADAVVIAAGASADVDFEQIEISEVEHTVTEEKAYYEVLFDADITPNIHSFEVFVDEEGEGLVEWDKARLFQNTNAESTVFDEFYSHNDQLGIRFGNGDFGKIPPLGATILVVFRLTEGDTFLLDRQNLYIVGELLDYAGQPVNLTVVTKTSITGGRAIEDTEEIRRSLHYWPIYNERLVWQEDYIFFLKRRFPEILWINVWGEQEATQANNNIADLDFINKIFVSAFINDPNFDTEAELLAALEEARPLNRVFEWVEPIYTPYSLIVTGTVHVSENLAAVIQNVKDALTTAYGPHSADRSDVFVLKDAYALISGTGHFDRAGSSFLIRGGPSAAVPRLNEMIYLNINGGAFSITY